MCAQFGGYATRAETTSSPIYDSERVFCPKNRYGINYLSLIHTDHVVIQASTITQQNTSALLFGEITSQFKFDTIKYQILVCESQNLEEHILVPRTSPLFFWGGLRRRGVANLGSGTKASQSDFLPVFFFFFF